MRTASVEVAHGVEWLPPLKPGWRLLPLWSMFERVKDVDHPDDATVERHRVGVAVERQERGQRLHPLAQHRAVGPNAREGPPHVLLGDLVDEGVDVALRVGRIADSNLIVRRLRPIDLVVCAAPSYWAVQGVPRHPEELASHAALTYSLLGPTPEWRFLVGGEPVVVPLSSRMDASDAAPLVQMALQGLGVVCLPSLLVKPHLDSGALQPVLQGTTPTDLWLYAAYTQRRHNSAALKALIEFLEHRWREA